MAEKTRVVPAVLGAGAVAPRPFREGDFTSHRRRLGKSLDEKIIVRNAPTHFCVTAYGIVSDVESGTINATVEMPGRDSPDTVLLRLRHPSAAPIERVTVNGKDWRGFSRDTETIELKGLTGTVTVTANYQVSNERKWGIQRAPAAIISRVGRTFDTSRV